MKAWERDKKWSDKFLNEIKSNIGVNFIGEIKNEDCFRNTDLIVLKMEAVRFACRIRRFDYNYERYKNEFTIRSKRPSGNKTELRKIIEGFGDYIFYGFSDQQDSNLKSWFIGDLSVFRSWFLNELYKKGDDKEYKPRWIIKSNHDGSSDFYIFNVNNFLNNFIVAKNG